MTLYGVSRIGCKSTLLPTLTSIVNLSLLSACMPGQLKEAMVRPKLKKESLDFQEYSNFRPISNLKFVSKIIERAVAVQVKNYILLITIWTNPSSQHTNTYKALRQL